MNDGRMRRIASEWHGGQGSYLYSFSSTGAIHSDLEYEIADELSGCDIETHGEEAIDELTELHEYVKASGERGPQQGWSLLWEN